MSILPRSIYPNVNICVLRNTERSLSLRRTGIRNASTPTVLLLGPLNDTKCYPCFPQVGSETFYSFKYQIKEGNCPVQSGLTWQECDYRDAEEAVSVARHSKVPSLLRGTLGALEQMSVKLIDQT